MGYYWWSFKLWVRELSSRAAWKLAWLLPRKVALFAFVRVSSAAILAPDESTYEVCYKAWERGAGK